jgi:hypothetical protein
MADALMNKPISADLGSTPWYRNKKLDQWICFWVIPVFYNIFGVVFVLLGKIMPPQSPRDTPEEIISFMQSPNLLLATVILVLSLGLSYITCAIVATHMRRMEGVSPAMAYAYMACFVVGSIPGCLFPMFCFALGAFRPEANPQTLLLLYDMGFLAFVGSLGCFCAQYMVFAIAILLDKRGIFPRWLAYLTIWSYVTEIVAGAAWMTKTGPFAWDGLLSFYLGTLIFVTWQMCLTVCLYKVIKNQPLSELRNASIVV